MLLNIESENPSMQKGNNSLSNFNNNTVIKKYRSIEDNINKIKSEISYGDSSPLVDVTTDFSSLEKKIVTPFIPRYFSSDGLLSILLIACGIIGAVTSALRDHAESIGRIMVLGATVGFVTLLGVKGGSTIFILTNAGINISFNAYNTALIGIVAGMFSEKLYLALSNITDHALNGKSANKALNEDAQ
jgi:hypothetical protein